MLITDPELDCGVCAKKLEEFKTPRLCDTPSGCPIECEAKSLRIRGLCLGFMQYKTLLTAGTPTPILLQVLTDYGLDKFGADLLAAFEQVFSDYKKEIIEREREQRQIEDETRKAQQKARMMG
jgi:hypothetical protein